MIFVNFDTLDSAIMAQKRLNGRAFGEAIVDARFYDESAFARSRLR